MIAGEKEHDILEVLVSGQRVRTACNQLIWRSKSDRNRTSAPLCVVCEMLRTL